MATAQRYRRSRPQYARVAGAVLLGGLLSAAFVLAFSQFMTVIDHGSFERRATLIAVHLSVAALTPWWIWSRLLALALQQRARLAGLALVVLTSLALVAPGVRTARDTAPAEVTRVRVDLPRLPAELEGTKILLLSDLHVGNRLPEAMARRRLAPLHGIDADLVVFAGDTASYLRPDVTKGARLLNELLPRRHRFAVLGNHDRAAGDRFAASALRRNGFTVLVNESQPLRLHGATIWVVGVNDPDTRADDLRQALRPVPADGFVLLLAHGPDVLRHRQIGRADLILAGHTHGGQIVLPLIGPLACSSSAGPRYASGLFTIGPSKLFITRGIGYGIAPVRVFCPPEIAVLELHRGRR